MKRGIFCVVLTIAVIFGMWLNSPNYKYKNRQVVETVTASEKNIYDSVIARGAVEEGDVRKIRLEQNSEIDEVYISVGDTVVKDALLFEVSKSDVEIDAEKVISQITDEYAVDAISKIMSGEDYKEIISEYYTPDIKTTAEFENEIISPISGVVTDVFVKKGDVAIYNSTVATISNFDKLKISVDVPELYINRIKIGQKAEITGDAFQGKKYLATVANISPVADKKNTLTGKGETTISVMLELKSKNHELRPGYSVSAKVYTDNKNNAVVVPYSCVLQDEAEREFVYVVRDEIAHKTAVKTGFELDDEVEIVSGVNKGDCVVLSPDDNMYDCMPIRLLEEK